MGRFAAPGDQCHESPEAGAFGRAIKDHQEPRSNKRVQATQAVSWRHRPTDTASLSHLASSPAKPPSVSSRRPHCGFVRSTHGGQEEEPHQGALPETAGRRAYMGGSTYAHLTRKADPRRRRSGGRGAGRVGCFRQGGGTSARPGSATCTCLDFAARLATRQRAGPGGGGSIRDARPEGSLPAKRGCRRGIPAREGRTGTAPAL